VSASWNVPWCNVAPSLDKGAWSLSLLSWCEWRHY